MAEAPESWEYVDPLLVYPTFGQGGQLEEVRVSEERAGILHGVDTTGIRCDSCGADVSPAALQASKGLDHVSPEAATAIEMQFKLKTRDLHLCAECFLAMYWMIASPEEKSPA